MLEQMAGRYSSDLSAGNAVCTFIIQTTMTFLAKLSPPPLFTKTINSENVVLAIDPYASYNSLFFGSERTPLAKLISLICKKIPQLPKVP